MGISIMLGPSDDSLRTPELMLYKIAVALGMSPECYKMKSREREISELRFIGAHFLRTHFPKLTLHQIAALFGGQDHTSIINGLTRANNLIYTGDARFLEKYNAALKTINPWLRKEASAFALAASA